MGKAHLECMYQFDSSINSKKEYAICSESIPAYNPSCHTGTSWKLAVSMVDKRILKTEPPEPNLPAAWMHAYQEKLQALLDQINANTILSLRERVFLLDAPVHAVQASLREARSFVRSEDRSDSGALEGQARKVLRRLQVSGKDARMMSDSELLSIGNVGMKTLAAIREILEKEE